MKKGYMLAAVMLVSAGAFAADAKPSYTDNGNGTLTDNNTGLTWVSDANSAGCNYGKVSQWPKAVEFCRDLTFAGHSDWRLPNREELMSIVAKGQEYLSIDTSYFPNTRGVQYWTSTRNDGGNYAWNVLFFYGGRPYYEPIDYYYYVRCVRGG